MIKTIINMIEKGEGGHYKEGQCVCEHQSCFIKKRMAAEMVACYR